MVLEFDIKHNEQRIYDMLTFYNSAYQNPRMKVLFDTGASFPVWVDDFELFGSYFPNYKSAESQMILKGFGLGYEVAPVFEIPRFVLSDEQHNYIEIRNMLVAAIKRDYTFQMILSYPVLEKMNWSHVAYFNRNGVRKIDPKLRITPHRQVYYMKGKKTSVTPMLLHELSREFPQIEKHITAKNLISTAYTFTQ